MNRSAAPWHLGHGLPQLDADYAGDDNVVTTFIDVLASLVERFRQRPGSVQEADPVTGNLLEGLRHELEKQYWMLRAQR